MRKATQTQTKPYKNTGVKYLSEESIPPTHECGGLRKP